MAAAREGDPNPLRPRRQPGGAGLRPRAARRPDADGLRHPALPAARAMSSPATLKILHPSLCTLVVDEGRPRSRSLGVPVGGAADRAALAVGNALVGNPPDAPAVEFTLTGPTLEADGPAACAVFGAPFSLAVNGRPLTAGTTFTLEPGDTLRIGGTPSG